MNVRLAVVTPAVGWILCHACVARAAGIALDVQSGRGTGMASAVTAMIDDSSAIFYNPAGIAQGKIIDVQVGDSLVLPTFRYTSPQGGTTSNSFDIVPPFQIYESGGITDDFSIGVGVFSPFGLTVEWPPDWAGKTTVTSASLATFDFNPTAAYRLGPLRIGAGLQLVRATVDLKSNVGLASDATAELGAATWGVGGNVGLQIEAIPRYLDIGVHYRSTVSFNFDGEAHFDGVPPALQGMLHDQRVTTTFATPDVLQMGIASRPTKDVVLDLDVVWYDWSKFQSLDLVFPNTPALNRSELKQWNDTVNVHLGGEVAVDPSWRVRGGVLYDPSPSPDSTLLPDVPDADRLNLAVGGSYLHPSGFRVDLGYQLIVIFKRTSTAPALPGDYDGFANVLGISLGYRTPARLP